MSFNVQVNILNNSMIEFSARPIKKQRMVGDRIVCIVLLYYTLGCSVIPNQY